MKHETCPTPFGLSLSKPCREFAGSAVEQLK
jgi:hypothetical protein